MMSLPLWVTNQAGDIVELLLAEREVLLVVIPSDPKASAAAILAAQNAEQDLSNSKKVRAWLQTVLAKSAGSAASAHFRLLGHGPSFAAVSAALRRAGLQEGQHVPFEEKNTLRIHFLPNEGRIRVPAQLLAPAPKPSAAPPKPLAAATPPKETEPPPVASSRKTRVLVVDDSETIRKLLYKILSEDPDIECVATIESPGKVIEAVQRHKPDVITLDIHMPEMNGVELLRMLLPQFAVPTVMISALSKEDGTYVLDALEAGAVDYIQKPSMSEIRTLAPVICEKVKNARHARVQHGASHGPKNAALQADLQSNHVDFSFLIAIGSSTGGTEALKQVLCRMPPRIPPILIVQHIPPVFSKAFADRINQLCPFEVKEAEEGDLVQECRVLIAPGGRQMRVKEKGAELRIAIDDGPPVNRHKPSVDVLFDSLAALKRKKIAAAILTGMGGDGASGLLKLRQIGARTLAQNEATSVVYGMPKEAVRLGAAEQVVPLGQVAECLLHYCAPGKRQKSVA